MPSFGTTIMLLSLLAVVFIIRKSKIRSQAEAKQEQDAVMAYNSAVRRIKQSISFAQNSKVMDTRKKHVAIAASTITHLYNQYPEDENLMYALKSCNKLQTQIYTQDMVDNCLKYTEKIVTAKTLATQINYADKIMAELDDAKKANLVDHAFIDEWKIKTNNAISQARYEDIQQKAEKLEGKGKTNQAIDSYLKLLLHLKTDSICDSEQEAQFAFVQQKLEKLHLEQAGENTGASSPAPNAQTPGNPGKPGKKRSGS